LQQERKARLAIQQIKKKNQKAEPQAASPLSQYFTPRLG
jgi:hypothetical protein